MPDFEVSITPLSYRHAPQIPQEWVTMVSKLNPITAAVVWQVLNGTITPATIALAKNSPDRDRYMLIGIIAGGNANACEEISEMAREELDEILTSVVPGYFTRRIRQ